MGLNQTANNKPCFAFSQHQGGIKNKDWLCELGCRALHMTCEMKNPCSAPRAFQSHCTGCFPFISAGRGPKNPTSKKYHNSKDSAGDRSALLRLHSTNPFPSHHPDRVHQFWCLFHPFAEHLLCPHIASKEEFWNQPAPTSCVTLSKKPPWSLSFFICDIPLLEIESINHSFIPSFVKYLLNTYYVPVIIIKHSACMFYLIITTTLR